MRVFISLLFFFIFSGCTSTTQILLTENIPDRPTRPEYIQVYLEGPPQKARPLAALAVSRHGSNSVWAVEILKMEAAILGADAITNLQMEYEMGALPYLKLQAVAVKYAK